MKICSRVRAAACSLSGPAGVLASSAWLRSAYGFGVTERSGGGFGVTGRGREGECR
ncbi:hypothetical protein ACWDU9_29865 [Streptomyces cellulosae]